MSAFMCDNKHLLRLAAGMAHLVPHSADRLLKRPQLSPPGKDRLNRVSVIAAALHEQNIASLQARYGERAGCDGLKPPKATTEAITAADFVPLSHYAKALSCYMYQACETDDWDETAVRQLCADFALALLHFTPGWGDAPWGAPEVGTFPLYRDR